MSGTLVVTDSTACLRPEDVEAHGIRVVPLQVVIGAKEYDEGAEGATPDKVAEALREFVPVSTSRPNPATMGEVYERAAAEGYEAVVSVHISGEMSGTFESAQLAARDARIPVHAVDSRQVGPATGYAAIAAAEVLAAGATAQEAAEVARARAAGATSLFYVDTLEYLRRGGRVGATAALLGGALAVKPLLRIDEGRVGTLEKVRTSSRALARLEELVVTAAGEGPIDLAVCHLASPERAEALTEALTARLAEQLGGRSVWSGELGAVLGAHVGPGMVAACVSPRDLDGSDAGSDAAGGSGSDSGAESGDPTDAAQD